MAFNKKQFKNNINLSGVVLNYSIKKDANAKRMFDGGDRFKKGDTYTSYNGYVDVLTSVEPMNYVRVNVQTEYKTYKSGNNVGKPTSATLALEEMANKTLPTYRKTGKVNETPTVSVFGNEPYNFKFTDNFYFKKDTMELVETINTDLGFANLVIGDPVDEPRFANEFTIHAYASKLDEELDKRIMLEEIEKLSPRDKEIIELRYGLNQKKEMTQKDVANLLGISQSYISRIEKKVIKKLKSIIKN